MGATHEMGVVIVVPRWNCVDHLITRIAYCTKCCIDERPATCGDKNFVRVV
jgi:hypothetical protein